MENQTVTPQQPVVIKITQKDLPYEFRPMSPLKYIGCTLLLLIPIVGLIMTLMYSFGGTENINMRNFARAFAILYAVVIVAAAAWIVFCFVTGTDGSVLETIKGVF